MNIDYPVPAQIQPLRQLWKEAFGDGDDFLDMFFTHGFSPCRCRCITQEGRLTAALYWFDVSCENRKFAYLYAVATAPAFRGRGLCRALVEDVKALLSSQGYAGLLLVPQTEQLAKMYQKMGFLPCTAVMEFTAPAEGPSLPLRRLNGAEYAAARRRLLPPGGVLQERENLEFLQRFSLFFEGCGWVAAVSPEGELLRCQELLGDADIACRLVYTLGCREGFFRIPGPDKPFAQYLPLTPDCVKPGYFGLAFD